MDVRERYLDWLYDMMCGERFANSISYRKLFKQLHDTEFFVLIARDRDRAEDGKSLRLRFGHWTWDEGIDSAPELVADMLNGPCSVLEMMVALAIRCERDIMDDPRYGDRTRQWFWNMIASLGLGSLTDTAYDRIFVEETLDRFLNREYAPNGAGGLFTIRNCGSDLRNEDIWRQLCWFLNNM